MKLLTDELRAQLPPLYGQENEADAMIYAKFFTPWTGWTWFVTEGSQQEDDFVFFGYVIGLDSEWGYFSLNELESIRGPGGMTIERDLYFTSQAHERNTGNKVKKREGGRLQPPTLFLSL